MRATLLLVVVDLFAMLECLSVLAMQKKFVRESSKVRRGKPIVAMPCAGAGARTMGFVNEKYEQIIKLNSLQNTNEHVHQANSTQ